MKDYGFTREGLSRYFANTSWLIAEKVFRMITVLAMNIYIARYLQPENFGLLNYAHSVVLLFSPLAALGLNVVVIRRLVESDVNRDALLGTTFWLKMFGALSVLLIMIPVLFVLDNDLLTNAMIMIIAISMLLQAFDIFDMHFQASVKTKYSSIARVIALVLCTLMKIYFIYIKADVIWFAAAISFELLISSILLGVQYASKAGKIRIWNFDGSLAIAIVKDSWPLIMSGTIVSIYMKIDQVMIKEMLNASQVGLYAAATKLSEAWYMIPSVICASLFPAIVNSRRTDKGLYSTRMQKLYDLLTVLSVITAIPVSFLASWIINVLYGSGYSYAGSVLMIHIWTGLFVSLRVASGKWLIAENMAKKSLYRSLVGVTINIFMNLMLIPMYGIRGAAIASLIAHFISGFLYDLGDKDTRSQFIMKVKATLFIGRIIHWLRHGRYA